ncbi:MAG: hypothetical protein KBA30_01030 [Clostridia bacterium]|nr:hypothetical protein [Clostridia bacterium]
MSDGYQPNPAPAPTPVPTSADQVIGEATSILGTFMKDPVGSVRAAWDQKKLVMALVVAGGFVVVQLLNSILSGWGYSKFGAILLNWIRYSVTEIVLLAVLAFVCTLLVHGHDSTGIVGALSGVGVAAIPYLAAFAASTVVLLIERILPFGVMVWICNLLQAALGAPFYIAMFILLALAVRRKTLREDDYTVAKNTVVLAVAFFVANYLVTWLLW